MLGPNTLIALVNERLRDPGAVGQRRATLYLADGEKRVFVLGNDD
jgi:hypothetical protein